MAKMKVGIFFLLSVCLGCLVPSVAFAFSDFVGTRKGFVSGGSDALGVVPGRKQTALSRDCWPDSGLVTPRGVPNRVVPRGVSSQVVPRCIPGQSRLFDMGFAGMPLVVAGFSVKPGDEAFRGLREGFLPDFRSPVDDYLQYLPAAVMLGLKAGGVESRSSWGRMLVSDAFSVLLMSGVVNGLKYGLQELRPDASNRRSFPSGHTATAFMTATMLVKEYGHKSPWVGVGAYTVASATGLMRVANNKHWISDVLAGAGIGILSTELGYYLADLIFKEKRIRHFPSRPDSLGFGTPSFLGLHMGFVDLPGRYRAWNGDRIRFSSGSSLGVEGAWFFRSGIGIGGRFNMADFPVDGQDGIEEERLDMLSVYAGAYFAYPLVPRLALGGNVSAGYVHASDLQVSGVPVSKGDSFGFNAGLSLSFSLKAHFGMRLYAACELLPGFWEHMNRNTAWILGFGGAFHVLLGGKGKSSNRGKHDPAETCP